MSIAAGDLAILIHPRHIENLGKICKVIRQVPAEVYEEGVVWWECEFPRPVKTDTGLRVYSAIRDFCLRKISGPPSEEIEISDTELCTA